MSSFALLQPVPDFASGGFLYNENLQRHWPREAGELQIFSVNPPDLVDWCKNAQGYTAIILDSLYLAAPTTMAALDVLSPLPVHFVLHAIPSELWRQSGVGMGGGVADASGEPDPTYFQLSKIEKLLLTKSRGYVATGPLLGAQLEAMGYNGIVAPPGVDPQLFYSANKKEPSGGAHTILTVGAVTPLKGQLEVAHALQHLQTTGGFSAVSENGSKEQPIEWVIAGPIVDEDYYNQLRETVERLKPKVAVHFMGNLEVAQVAELYRQADLFVLLSRSETWGMAVAEALSSGCRVLCADIPVMRYLWYNDNAENIVCAVDPDNVHDIGQNIVSMLTETPRTPTALAGLERLVNKLPTWPTTAAKVAEFVAG